MDAPPDTAPDLFALLHASIAEQRAADAHRLPVGPARCGSHGQHAWRDSGGVFGFGQHGSIERDGYGFRLVVCECGTRARIDHDGRALELDSWSPVAEPTARAAMGGAS